MGLGMRRPNRWRAGTLCSLKINSFLKLLTRTSFNEE